MSNLREKTDPQPDKQGDELTTLNDVGPLLQKVLRTKFSSILNITTMFQKINNSKQQIIFQYR